MSRLSILSSVRRSLQVSAIDQLRRAAVEARIASPPRVAAPSRIAQAGSNLLACFKAELERQLAAVVEVSTPSDIPATIADYLAANNQPLRLRHGSDPLLAAIDFNASTALETATGAAAKDDTAGLSVAFAGIAETGTMAILSGPENPVTVNFLPDTHIIVVPRGRLVGTYEDAFDLLRKQRSSVVMPRTLNLISGPSRTADIGGRIVIGAHGPRRLLAIVLNSA
jgi:L-lactate dehydrogenase complex protein LldG